MNLRTTLRASILLQWLLFPIALYLHFTLEKYLPSQLQSWLQYQAKADITSSDLLMIFGLLLLIPGLILGSVGVYEFKRWGAITYLFSVALSLLLLLFSGPIVEHAIIYIVYELSSLVEGVTITLIFVTGMLNSHDQNRGT
jgi:hypothetical protein